MQFDQDEICLVQELTEEFKRYARLKVLMSDYSVDFLPSLYDLEGSYEHLIRGFEYKMNEHGGETKEEIENSISHLRRANRDLLEFVFIQKVNEFFDLAKKTNQKMLKDVGYDEILQDIKIYARQHKDKHLESATTEDIDRFIHLITRIDYTKSTLMKASIKNGISEQKAREKERYTAILLFIIALVLGILLGPIVINQFI